MKFDSLEKGELNYDVTTNILDTSHIITDKSGQGPFYFYFQARYDSQLEGPLSLTLNKYDQDTLKFTEYAIYEV